MATIEVKNDYMLGRQNERMIYDKCVELEIRIGRAIEYIENISNIASATTNGETYISLDILLKILKGVSNE